MHPMFSLHPYEPARLYDIYLPEARAIKDLAQRYNVQEWLTLKNSRILDAGFQAGVATLAHVGADGKWRSYLDSDDYDYYTLLGCSEFTDNKNMSLGLNW